MFEVLGSVVSFLMFSGFAGCAGEDVVSSDGRALGLKTASLNEDAGNALSFSCFATPRVGVKDWISIILDVSSLMMTGDVVSTGRSSWAEATFRAVRWISSTGLGASGSSSPSSPSLSSIAGSATVFNSVGLPGVSLISEMVEGDIPSVAVSAKQDYVTMLKRILLSSF